MKTTKFIALAVSVFALAVAVSAQKKTTFTSTYTSLSACKELKGSNGTDPAYICKGPGGYQLRIYSSATMTHIAAELKDESYPIANVGFDWNQDKAKAEWRLANGKPFAIILRIPKYADRTGETVGKKIGEELFVSGIGEWEFISEAIDAKKANANAKARAAADKGYKQ